MSATLTAIDQPLDAFLPRFDVVERHRIHVRAPVDKVFRAACDVDLDQVWIARLIFRAREVLFRSKPAERVLPRGLVAKTRALGWGTLSEVPGREIVMGAITQPWLADVEFHALPAAQFAGFQAPQSVKIAWVLRVDPDNAGGSEIYTETRAVACDAESRAKFRWYWRCVSPGIRLIRHALLRAVRKQAEARA